MKAVSEKIKATFTISDFRVGGAQKLVADIVSKLDTAKFDVSLIVLVHSEEESNFYNLIPEHVHVEKLGFKSFYDFKSWGVLYRVLKNIKPDVVCSNLFFSNTILRVLKIFCHYKVITVEHNVYVGKSLLHRCIDKVLSFVTYRIVAVSESVLDYTAKTQHIPKDKFKVISNGVDVSYFIEESKKIDVATFKTELGFTENDKIILSIGQLIKQKNHTLLVRAFSEFIKNEPEYKLVIVGGGAKQMELEKEIVDRSLTEKVKMVGIRKDLVSFYAVSDLFVLPSLFEGFALVCIEAMATGVPVVSTKVAGPNVYIEDGKNGFFTELDEAKLCEKMKEVVHMAPDKRREIILNAVETSKHYDIKNTVKNYEYLFEQAAP